MRTIVVEGDSTASGWLDYERGGWPQRLHTEFLPKSTEEIINPVTVKNRASPGRTLRAIRRELEPSVDPILLRSQGMGSVALVLQVGFNEAKIFAGNKRPVFTEEQFEEDLVAVRTLCAPFDAPIVYVGPIDMNDGTPRPKHPYFDILGERVAAYGAILRNHAAKSGMPYVDTGELFGPTASAALSGDGYHPNELGHALLHGAIKDALTSVGAFNL